MKKYLVSIEDENSTGTGTILAATFVIQADGLPWDVITLAQNLCHTLRHEGWITHTGHVAALRELSIPTAKQYQQWIWP